MKRYVIELDAYLYASNDAHARMLAREYAAKLGELGDCQPAVLSLHEQPFGTLGNRPITI